MDAQNLVLDERWNVVWNYSETSKTAPEKTNTATHFFEKIAVKLLNKPSSLRSEKKELDLAEEINKSISWKDKERLDKAMEDFYGYCIALIDWGDKKWAETVIDKFNEIYQN